MAKDIIRHVEDGVEFFTIRATGESGMSKAGLALFCGVSKMAVSKLLARFECKPDGSSIALKAMHSNENQCKPDEVAESLKQMQGKSLSLSTGSSYKNVDIVPDDVCSAVIEYYAFDSPRPTDRAKESVRGFLRIGLRAYIHGITGWSHESQNIRAYLVGLIVDEPNRWDEHFPESWRTEAERVTGWKWNDRVMGKFLNEAVYSYFPQELRIRLDQVNPMGADGRRANKQHQHFTEPADDTLRQHIKVVEILLQASVNLAEFRRLMAGKFNGTYQLALKF